MAIFAEVIENECIIERDLRDIDPVRDSPIGPAVVLCTRPIQLRAEVSKQISE